MTARAAGEIQKRIAYLSKLGADKWEHEIFRLLKQLQELTAGKTRPKKREKRR